MMLVPLQSLAPDKTDAPPEKSNQVTYILDRDLIRFIKFAGSVVALVVIVGGLFYGIDLKQAVRDVRDVQTETENLSKEVEAAKNTAVGTLNDAKRISSEAAEKLTEIKHQSDEAQGIVSNIKLPNGAAADRQTMGALLTKYLQGVLTEKQLAELEVNIKRDEQASASSQDEVLKTAQADVEKAFAFFRQRGFAPPPARASLADPPDSMNVYWDGQQVVIGMGIVDSEIFGPYEPGTVYHEATHALFNIAYQGESGSVSESICDVMAVVIRGEGWTIGRVRTDDSSKPQFVRSLEAPGTAYDSPLIGKDPQVDHMSRFVKTENDNGGVHTNNGIINKAAYLISEGGNFHGVTIAGGIGRERLGQLYMETIKRLPKNGSVNFVQFRDLVIATAQSSFNDASVVETVRSGFRAVGL
jgi:Thermolysin metallopeptidase, alpha-helical domain